MGQVCLQCKYKQQVENVQKNKIKKYFKTINVKPGDIIVAHPDLYGALRDLKIKDHPAGKFEVPVIFTNDVQKKVQVIETELGDSVSDRVCDCLDSKSDAMGFTFLGD